MSSAALVCPDCEELLHYAFHDTSGVGAWKLGGGFATTPDSAHYVCFYCAKAWKQRLDGPLTPDMIGEINFFTCKATDCGARLEVTKESPIAKEIELSCGSGHRYRVARAEDGELSLVIAG